jgi:hypothetical protein
MVVSGRVVGLVLDGGPLRSNQRLALVALAEYVNDERHVNRHEAHCFPSVPGLAERCCVTVRSMEKTLAALVRDDWLTIDYRTGQRSFYRIDLDKLRANAKARADARTGGEETPVVEDTPVTHDGPSSTTQPPSSTTQPPSPTTGEPELEPEEEPEVPQANREASSVDSAGESGEVAGSVAIEDDDDPLTIAYKIHESQCSQFHVGDGLLARLLAEGVEPDEVCAFLSSRVEHPRRMRRWLDHVRRRGLAPEVAAWRGTQVDVPVGDQEVEA